ncbi:transglycosylase domain-containing protein [Micromonospora sp. NPDC000207]|uniref:transglycosylase domain-containing protein n=1 Tax=Micromonospora sp. NPDC000207 TaxID=3154246 RepID=UPI003324A393
MIRTRARTRLDKVVTALLAGLLAGLALAVAALPAALVLGIGVQSTIGAYAQLPQSLRTPPTAQRSNLYANDGVTLITSFYTENRTDVRLAEVAPMLRHAVVAAEDLRFYQHRGVDARAVLRAFTANQRGDGPRQGASTLTMQYVRNVLRSDPRLTEEQRQAATEISTGRKLQEMRYALAVERELSKDEILAGYLNIAYFGAGAYGVGAASQRFFSKSPRHLTLAESALLAGLLQSPDTDEPIHGDAEAALSRRSYVLDQLVAAGQVTAVDADRARIEPLRLNPSEVPNDCTAVSAQRNDWGFFCDWFTRWWSTQPEFGATPQERQRTLRQGGFRIVTTLDPTVQAATQTEVLRVYGVDHPHTAPTAVVEPGTGRVLALAVNRRYGVAENPAGLRNRPHTVNQLVAGGGDIVGYQAGSTFKLFTMLAALEAGLPLRTTFDAPTQLVTGWKITGANSCGGFWCPSNANPAGQNGPRTMWDAFGLSVNTYFAWLAGQVGADRVVAMAERLGIVLRAEEDARLARYGAREWGPFTLGVAATTPLDLAGAYATVAAEGMYCKPTPVLSVTDGTGRPVAAGGPACKQVLDTEVARAAVDAARCPVGDQSMYAACTGGTATALRAKLGRPVAGKTGSSEGYGTETVVAFTPQVAVATMAANPDDPGDPVGLAVQSRLVDLVGQVLTTSLRHEPVRDFVPPGAVTANQVTGPRAGN